jgi:hypothetical protein
MRKGAGLGLVLMAAALSPLASAEIVYQNLNSNARFFQPIGPGEQIGDDVTLAAGTARFITGFSVPITNTYANPFTGAFTARFYDVDENGLPGQQLWQGSLNLVALQGGADTTLDFPAPNVNVPDTFIWSLAATTIPAASNGNDQIGTLPNNVPQIGSSEDAFYYNAGDGSGWGAFDYQPGPDLANFQATIVASVPEPTAFATLAIVGCAGLLGRKRRA